MSFVARVEPYDHHQNSENFSEFCCTPSDDGDGTTLWRGRRSTDKFGASDNVGASNATDIGATKSGGGTATSNGGRASRGGRDTAGASTVAANASTRVEAVGKMATVGGSVPGVLFTAVGNNRQRPSAAIWGRRETGRRHRAARRRRQQRRASAVAAAIDNGRQSGHAAMLCVGRYVPTPFAAVPSPLSIRV